MRHNFLKLVSLSAQLLVLTPLAVLPARGQSEPKECRKPPKILSQPKTPEEYRDKWKKVRAQGKVAITIGEDGHVSDARVIEASPREAADALLATSKTIAFQPRPGCGKLKTEMVFSLNR